MTDTTPCPPGTCTSGPGLRCPRCGRLPLVMMSTLPMAPTTGVGESGRGPQPPSARTITLPATPEAKEQFLRGLAELPESVLVIGPRTHEADQQGALVGGGADTWAPLVDLSSERVRREVEETGEAAFSFVPFSRGDDGDVDAGFIEHATHPVTLLTEPGDLSGVCFTVKDAKDVGDALLDMVATVEAAGAVLPGAPLPDEVFTRREVRVTVRARASDGETHEWSGATRLTCATDEEVVRLGREMGAVIQYVVRDFKGLPCADAPRDPFMGELALMALRAQQETGGFGDALEWLGSGDGARLPEWPEDHVLRLMTGLEEDSWRALGGVGPVADAALVLFRGQPADTWVPLTALGRVWEPSATAVLQETWRRVRSR